MENIAKQSQRLARQLNKVAYFTTTSICSQKIQGEVKRKNCRFMDFQWKLRSRTPFASLKENSQRPFEKVDALKPWPNNKNPYTGEIGGPSGPEPTRYGDWERRGRVSDF